jgi:signal transduction histidine kinase
MKKSELLEEIKSLKKQLKRQKDETRNLDEEKDRFEEIKTRFIDAVAHELRTPVTPIKAAAEILNEESIGYLSEQQRGFLEIVRRNTARLEHLIEEVTTLSRLESGGSMLKLQHMSIWEAASGAVKLIRKKAREKDILISVGTQTEFFAWADPHAVSLVVSNLVENAVVHNPEGTRITVSTQLVSRNKVRVCVTDNGKGIPEKELDGIFSRFSISHEKHYSGAGGAGIGLSVCKRLVEKMGGEIDVESKVEQGTTFAFTLPIHEKTHVNSH